MRYMQLYFFKSGYITKKIKYIILSRYRTITHFDVQTNVVYMLVSDAEIKT